MKTLFRYLSILFLTLTSLPIASLAQSTMVGVIVKDVTSPVPFANVLLLQASDSVLVKGLIGNMDGGFKFENIQVGNYLVSITALGYETQYTGPFQVTEKPSQIEVDSIFIQVAPLTLEKVTISAKKPLYEQKIDRLVINVSNSITAAGGTALQVLERSPGVIVNKQWSTITMGGKEGVLIMINGKISRMPATAIVQMLDGMSADNIEKIELIHTPPANFEAQGNAGIIHIVLKESMNKGLNGTYSLNAGYGKKEKAGANLNFNFRKNKINLFGDYAYSLNRNPQLFTQYRSFIRDNKTLSTNSQSNRDTKTHNNQARLGLDYQLSQKTIVGLLAGWSDRDFTMQAFNTMEKRVDGALTESIEIPNNEVNHWQHVLGNFNIQHKFNDDNNLNVDIDYAYYYFTNPTHYSNQYFDIDGAFRTETERRADKINPMGIWVGKADYSRKLNANIILEAGLKATSTRFENDLLVEDLDNGDWIPNPLYTANYRMEEDIAMAYTSFTIKLTESANLKTGLRYEYTRSNLGTDILPNIIDRKYGNLFPSVFYNKNFNETNQFQFSYGRRIKRPNFTELAPFFIFWDPSTIATGNPKLQPSISNILNLSYKWKTIQLSAQYSYEKDAIGQYQPTIDIENDIQIQVAKNFEFAQVASTTLSFPIRLAPGWEMRHNITAQWQKVKDSTGDVPVEISRKSWYYNGNMTFNLPGDLTGEISGLYFAKSLFGALDIQPLGELSFGVQKELPNKDVLKINVNDVFTSNNWSFSSFLPEHNYVFEGKYRFAERVFRITYTHNFGNAKLKKVRARKTGSEEERNRVQ